MKLASAIVNPLNTTTAKCYVFYLLIHLAIWFRILSFVLCEY